MDGNTVGNIIMTIMIALAIFSGFFYKMIINKFNVNVSKDKLLNKLNCILGIIIWTVLFMLIIGLADEFKKYLYIYISIGAIVLLLLFILIFVTIKKIMPTILILLLIIIVGPVWIFAIGFGKI
jgi:hypothetical protein